MSSASTTSREARCECRKKKPRATAKQILISAARLFRERGIGATGVDSITEAAGLTHGGLYSHFGSKQSIVAEAVRFALARSRRVWRRAAQGKPEEKALSDILAYYLSRAHRDAHGQGCLVAALSCDIARQPPAVRKAFTGELKEAFEFLGRPDAGRHFRASPRGGDRSVCRHGWRSDSRAGGRRRGAFAADTENHGAAAGQGCQDSKTSPLPHFEGERSRQLVKMTWLIDSDAIAPWPMGG